MPQVSQSSSNFDNRIDPTFGLGNLAKAADTVTENRRKQAGVVNAVRQTLAMKGVKDLKGTITVGEDGIQQFSDPSDREKYYSIARGGKNDRSKQGAGTNAGVELKRADVGAMQARTDGIIAPQDNLANQIINRKVPTTVPGTTMPALPSGTPPTLPTLGSAPTVTPGAAGGAAAAVKSVMAANGVAPAPTVAPAGSTSAHASSNASSAASSYTSMTGGGYSETQHDYFENTKNTDIAVHDGVQMDLADLAAADLNATAAAGVAGTTAPVVFQNLMKQYSAVTDSINAALGKQGTEQTMTTGGSTTVNRQGIGANVSNNMQSQTINNIGGSNNTTGSGKVPDVFRGLRLNNGNVQDYKFDTNTNAATVPIGTQLLITSNNYTGANSTTDLKNLMATKQANMNALAKDKNDKDPNKVWFEDTGKNIMVYEGGEPTFRIVRDGSYVLTKDTNGDYTVATLKTAALSSGKPFVVKWDAQVIDPKNPSARSGQRNITSNSLNSLFDINVINTR